MIYAGRQTSVLPYYDLAKAAKSNDSDKSILCVGNSVRCFLGVDISSDQHGPRIRVLFRKHHFYKLQGILITNEICQL